MGSILTVHSYRRGTGKSFVAANLAAALAGRGLQVGLIDSNSQFPSLQYLFRLETAEMGHTLQDHLLGKCDLLEAVIEVSDRLDAGRKGRLFLVPGSGGDGGWQPAPRQAYDLERLFDGLNRFIKSRRLDVLLVDTSAGLNDDSLPFLAGANVLVEIMRPDRQDFSGTATVLFTAQKLDVPRRILVVNQIPQAFALDEVRRQVEKAYDCPVAALMRYAEEVACTGSAGLFCEQFPDHEISHQLAQLAEQLTMYV